MWLLVIIVVVIPFIIGITVGIVQEVQRSRSERNIYAPSIKQRIVENCSRHPKTMILALVCFIVTIIIFVFILKY